MEHLLTPTDRKILDSYLSVLEGFSAYLGSSCEVVLHSLEDYDHSVIGIWGVSHTGRTVGAPITDVALQMLSELTPDRNSMVYFTTNKHGEPLRSTTIAIRGEGARIIGLICINQYLNTPLSELLSTLIPAAPGATIKESFSSDADELICDTLERVRLQVLSDESISPSCKNKAIVEELNEQGIFRLKNAVVTVAKALGISRNTVYMHLRNCRTDAAESETETRNLP